MSRVRWIALVLFVLTFAIYWPVRHFDFINYDDPVYVTENDEIKKGFSVESLSWVMTGNLAGNWTPATSLSHLVDYQLFGVNAGLHHLENALWHSLNTALLLLLLFQLTGSLWPSVFVAALFGWHPMHVESVAWVSERKDVLSTFFLILCLGAYVRYARTKSKRFYWTAFLFLSIGLLAKPMLVTAPFLFLLLDVWPLKRVTFADTSTRQSELVALLKEKVPFLFLALISGIITFLFQQNLGATRLGEMISFPQRIATVLIAYETYLAKLLWPQNLGLIYPHPLSWPVLLAVQAAVVLLGISIGAVLVRKRLPYVLFGWIWFLVTLSPVIGLVPIGEIYMADRYSYIPSIGLFVEVSWTLWALAERKGIYQGILVFCACSVLLATIIGTRYQLSYWRDSISILERTLAVTKNNVTAHYNLGNALIKRGQIDQGMQHHFEAIKINPRFGKAYGAIGLVF